MLQQEPPIYYNTNTQENQYFSLQKRKLKKNSFNFQKLKISESLSDINKWIPKSISHLNLQSSFSKSNIATPRQKRNKNIN